MIEEDDQPVQITLSRDVALVLYDLLEEAYENDTTLVLNLSHEGEWGAIMELLGKIETHIVEVLLPDYAERVNSARKRLHEKHGWRVGYEPSDDQD